MLVGGLGDPMISPLEHTKVQNDSFYHRGLTTLFVCSKQRTFCLNCVARLVFLRGSDLIGQLVMLLLYHVSGFCESSSLNDTEIGVCSVFQKNIRVCRLCSGLVSRASIKMSRFVFPSHCMHVNLYRE